MIPLSKTAVNFAEGVRYEFPTDSCCNCATSEGLMLVVQDTKLTRFMLAGGSEYTFRFNLPFCSRCKKSSKRRPPTGLQIFLVTVLASFGAFALALASGLSTESAWVLEHSALLSAIAGVAGVALWYASRRRQQGQSTYYQPVRVTKLRQEFLSGKVKGIRFRFMNPFYARRFEALNHEAITSGVVEVRAE